MPEKAVEGLFIMELGTGTPGRSRVSEFGIKLCVCDWRQVIKSRSLNFLISKMGIRKVPSQDGCSGAHL